jgi:predicted kinase
MSQLIALCGRSGAGKDVVASRLVEVHGFRRIAVADHLKEVMKVAFNVSNDQLWGEGRNVVDDRWGLTPRAMYQQLGDALRNIHPESLLQGWTRQVREALATGAGVVVPDVRMPAEAEVVRGLRGSMWRVLRKGTRLEGAASGHITETASEGFVVDVQIDNDASIDALHAIVDEKRRGQ